MSLSTNDMLDIERPCFNLVLCPFTVCPRVSVVMRWKSLLCELLLLLSIRVFARSQFTSSFVALLLLFPIITGCIACWSNGIAIKFPYHFILPFSLTPCMIFSFSSADLHICDLVHFISIHCLSETLHFEITVPMFAHDRLCLPVYVLFPLWRLTLVT